MNENKKKITREFWLSNLAVDNRTSIYVLITLIVIMGVTAYINMPRENFPEIKIPEIYIGVAYPGNSPMDMENLVTRPIEKELNTITGVDKISSTSMQDYSSIQVVFDMDEDVDEALADVKDAVDVAKQELPNDLPADPNVFKVDITQLPILNINISGYENLDVLEDYAEYLQEKIENLPEISRVDIKGLQEKEVAVEVDVYQMESRNISFYDIEQAIGQENVTISGGDVLEGGLRRNIRVVGEFDNPVEIENIIVKSENQNLVYLKDIANVNYGYGEATSYSRAEELTVVTLDVVKRSGTNLIDASDKIKNILTDAKVNVFPDQLEVELINDTSKVTKSMVSELENSIISGVILVVMVLLFFLGLRNALFVGIAIPLSMLMGFMIFNFMGYTLNMMILFSLIMALGMMVDNAIVVVENIYRLLEQGYSHIRAAKEGVGEVALPIIASTATTLAAFAPLLFWNDIMGEFMKFLPITLIIVLSSSLFVALVVNPVLTSALMKVEDPESALAGRSTIITAIVFIVLAIVCFLAKYFSFGTLFAIIAGFILINAFILQPISRVFLRTVMPALESGYKSLLRFALNGLKPILFFAGTIGLLILSVMLLGSTGLRTSLFPDNEPNFFFVYVEFPVGTDIEKTNEYTKKVEEQVIETLEPYEYMTEAILANVGEGTGDPQMGADQGNTPHRSRVSVFFKESRYRKGASPNAIMEEVRTDLADFPGPTITLQKEANGPPTGPPINIEITGEDIESLLTISKDLREFINDQDIAGIQELKMDMEVNKPELLLNIDREKARSFGLSTGRIASDIRTAIFGKEVSKYKEGEDEYPINLRLNSKDRYDLGKVLNQKVTFQDQNSGKIIQVPVSSIANPEYGFSYGSIKRKDLDRSISLYSNVIAGYNGNEIVQQLRKATQNYSLPEGYSVKFTGEQEEQQESTEFLMRAMMIAVFLIFLIIVSQFNSVAMPLIIVMSVILSTIGVFLGYVVFRMDFIILMTGIGIISLAGIVVNNAIVLIDYINLMRQRKRKELGLMSSILS